MSKDIRVPEGYKKTELGVISEECEVVETKIQLPFPEEQTFENVEELLEETI